MIYVGSVFSPAILGEDKQTSDAFHCCRAESGCDYSVVAVHCRLAGFLSRFPNPHVSTLCKKIVCKVRDVRDVRKLSDRRDRAREREGKGEGETAVQQDY